jgi:hypothetical protein
MGYTLDMPSESEARRMYRTGALDFLDTRPLLPVNIAAAFDSIARLTRRDISHPTAALSKPLSVIRAYAHECAWVLKRGKHYVAPEDRVDLGDPTKLNLAPHSSSARSTKGQQAKKLKELTCRKRACREVFEEGGEDESEDAVAWDTCRHCGFRYCPAHLADLAKHERTCGG